ncbi:MAG: class I SAM-dependent methyltransferase [Planctomycetaceae bacterium]|nr:class I SAM-dependent methyltransferase [Planctomycetaceae bacterium]
MGLLSLGIDAAERGLVPDRILRAAIRRQCARRLADEHTRAAYIEPSRDWLSTGPIALAAEQSNEQHYELPAEFFERVLGPHRKYSCCYFAEPETSLEGAESEALRRSCELADLRDGQNILELGCGWGALSLWMAERYPASRITAVSNSAQQRWAIQASARARGLSNLQVITCDVNHFAPGQRQYDRVVSIEMFEHLRNFRRLLSRIAEWLHPDGKLYVHLFCHRALCYPFETDGAANWMGRHFFTGGLMPSADLLENFPDILRVTRHEKWNGQHYQRTADAWLARLDGHRLTVRSLLAECRGPQQADRWLQRWRMFFLAVSELFGFAQGNEWFVSHYLLEQPSCR